VGRYLSAIAIAVCTYLGLIICLPCLSLAEDKQDVVVLLPLSGKGASHGEYVRDGLSLFERDNPLNPFHVVLVDSESAPEKAVTGLKQQLLLRKPVAVISVLSGIS
jgi:hypothetical protein